MERSEIRGRVDAPFPHSASLHAGYDYLDQLSLGIIP
jgi:hypothetical protein